MESLENLNKILGEIEATILPKHKRAIFGYPITVLALSSILFFMFLGAPLGITLGIIGFFLITGLFGFYFIYNDFKIFKLRKKIDMMQSNYSSTKSLSQALEILNTILNGTGHAIDGIKLASRKIESTKKLIASGEAAHPAYAEKFLNDRMKDKFYNESLIQYYLHILNTIRTDLSNKIKEQLPILHSAKGELEMKLGGSLELVQTAELQKIRLDRQIEQFEELQKVLVKI